jgi:O-antigen/teichoic acid export membrane protein
MPTQSARKEPSLTINALWMFLARTLGFVFSFALPLFLVRRLDQSAFGIYKQIFLFVGSAVVILPLGVSMSAYYYLPREQDPARRQQIVFNLLLINGFVGLLVCLALVIQPGLLTSLFHTAEMREHAPLVGVLILTWIISALLEVIPIAHQEVRLASLLIIVTQTVKSVVMLTTALMFGTVRSLIWAAIILGIIQTAILLIYLRSRFGNYWRGFEWSLMRTQLAYALPLGIASILYRVQSEMDNYFVSYTFDAAIYAVYAIGCFQIPLVDILNDAALSVVITRVSYLQNLGQRREILEVTARMMRKLAAVYFPLYVLLLVVGREFILFLFTARYLPSWPIFAVNLILIPLSILASGCNAIMRAYAEHRYFILRVRLVMGFLLFIGLMIATRHFGLLGAVIVMSSINVIDRLIVAYKSARILEVGRRDLALFADIGKLAIASLLAGVVAMAVRSFVITGRPIVILISCSTAFVIVYLVTIVILGTVTIRERESIRQSIVDLRQRPLWKRATSFLF